MLWPAVEPRLFASFIELETKLRRNRHLRTDRSERFPTSSSFVNGP